MRTRPGAALVVTVALALLMQSFASVQSILMQATMSASGYMVPICSDRVDDGPAKVSVPGLNGDQSGAVGTPPHDHGPGAPHSHESVCPFCAASVHAPIIWQAAPLRPAMSFVFIAFHFVTNHSPRGPPACVFRARAPPAIPLTA